METIKVFWKDKFDGKSVAINATDFNPDIHRHAADGRWPAEEVEGDGESADGLEEKTVAELRAVAEELGVELKSGLNKAAIIEAIRAGQ